MNSREEEYDECDEHVIELKKTIDELKYKIKLYELSTTLDYNKINKQKDYIHDIETYLRSVEQKNKILNEQCASLTSELQIVKKRVDRYI